MVSAVEAYLAAGVVFAVPFVLFGAGRLDPLAREGTRGFRAIILPGVAALWPLLLVRWLAGRGVPGERNAHRRAARAPRGGDGGVQ